MIDAGVCTEAQMAKVAVSNRKNAMNNPFAQLKGDFDSNALLEQPYLANPLRQHDCPPISDGACAVILAAGDRARDLCKKPAWIRGIDHRIEAHSLGARKLTESTSTAISAKKLDLANKTLDIAELHAPFTHQEVLLKTALGLSSDTSINPSGGALAANPMMVAGLTRIGEAASRLSAGDGKCGIAHATSGPCLQQNLVCLLEVD
jgi:acetyl-CoA acetyltransferase